MKIEIPLQDRNPWIRALGMFVFLILSLVFLVIGLGVVAIAFLVLVALTIFILAVELLDVVLVKPGAYVLFKLFKLPRP